ncbi:N-terminal double-transmembrane domain-containing protein [Sinomicrobium oceani]|uniref:N-terminal double-transmembrane domain-containing protein n=1 Tax=Sinomicrobium oceani TaxID=1150368 RepID=A0A1K1LRI9_9FLAO|nr:BatA domain-containing protein [Sinomicrobium oceani]SFW13487.1 N-terminal double-transmembrane domain-containing protein [Sinomicrobium oceani]
MHFKHPEILWALFFLLIPVIIHLFRLRRFQKTPFTNVKFLKAIQQKTRKSSQVKKWLVLLTRMALLTCLIIAFARPYYPHSEDSGKTAETVIYLDNSFSMQARGAKGELLQQAIRDIIAGSQDTDGSLSLFTNDRTYAGISISAVKQELLQLGYAAEHPEPKSVILRGKNLFGKDTTTRKNFILISDFSGWTENDIPPSDSLVSYNLVQLTPQHIRNTTIDSIYLDRQTGTQLLTVLLSKNDSTALTLPVSLYDDDTLIAKTTAAFDGSKTKAEFRLTPDQTINGKVTIDDNGLLYDNIMYFNLDTGEKVKVLAIGEAESDVLKRIFTDDEFDYLSRKLSQLDYSLISRQDLVVLHGLNNVPSSLQSTLKTFTDEGKNILIIPSGNPDQESYLQLFKALKTGTINKIYTGNISVTGEHSGPQGSNRKTGGKDRKKITDIRLSHPLFEQVFEGTQQQLTNFQYPEAYQILDINTAAGTVLGFEDGRPFLAEKDRVYFFTAPLDASYSNFRNSPLIVPVLYNIGKSALKAPQLYYLTGKDYTIDIRTDDNRSSETVLSIEKEGRQFIPMQRTFPGKIQITTGQIPLEDGIYHIQNPDSILRNISFNYDRKESDLRYLSPNTVTGIPVYDSVQKVLTEIKNTGSIRELWKWFVIFALVFLVTEILLLKLFK